MGPLLQLFLARPLQWPLLKLILKLEIKNNISRGITVSRNFPFSWAAVNFTSNPEKTM